MWTYTLSVAPSGGGGPPGGHPTLDQTSPTTASVQSTSSGTFAAGPITVENGRGAVTFVTTKSSPEVAVSSAGLISATGPLSAGTYNVSGTDSDPLGDTGTWTFTLTVTAVPVTVTFNANGGTGEMASETESAPTALSLNGFAWAKHTFVDWNTSANGTGVSYANGSLFPFSTGTELFAQWKMGKVPFRTITFAPNGGAGTMVAEIHNTPTAISPNHFLRTGYSFLDWNTKANGSGRSYAAGSTYSFTASTTFYAQWTKVKKIEPPPKVRVVTFNANGGAGLMTAEDHPHRAALVPNHFTRAGYTFLHWSTKANGSGGSYANGAAYSFSASTTLYAQWKKDKTVVPPPPPVPSGTQIGPFAAHTSTLSPALEAQIESLAVEAMTKKSTVISLLGYGDALSTADANNPTFRAANITLSRNRAQAVATYLGGRLTALGLKGWAISIAAAPNGRSGSGQGANSIVIAALS
jgi:outer membrane protein OmpA-like peptidoglycan-associated protein